MFCFAKLLIITEIRMSISQKSNEYLSTHSKNWFKISVGLIVCLLFRLIPFRPPNIEPILATQMPMSKVYGPLLGFVFGFLSIVLFDFLVGRVGLWTIITASTYGLLGVWSVFYFKKRAMKRKNFVLFSIWGTLAYDAITGLTIGPLFFNQPFIIALVGQIPFTALHLIGSVTFAFFVSPLMYKYLVTNPVLDVYIDKIFIRVKNA